MDCRPYLPPEWAPQRAIMLTWPHADTDWADDLDAAEQTFVEIAITVTRFESLLVVCSNPQHRNHVIRRLRAAGADPSRVHLAVADSNDSWARDHGPLTVLCGGEARLLDFTFNAWGGKFEAGKDNAISRTLSQDHALGDTPMESVPLILEGGAVEVDGSGSLLATISSVVTDTRNPGLTQRAMEHELKIRLGLTRILWLQHGHLQGDDTDAHIDTLARFCDRHTIAYVHCDDVQDEHYADLAAMAAELEKLHDASGQPYRLIPLPWPAAVFGDEGRRLPATYANFLIINGAVLLPVYGDAADDVARQQLASVFPDREIVAINCLPLIRQNGSLHCVTMQLPEAIQLTAPTMEESL